MRKILFDDRFDSNHLVLEGVMTMTVRSMRFRPHIIRHMNPEFLKEGTDPFAFYEDDRGMCRILDKKGRLIRSEYRVGDIVAIQQRYSEVLEPDTVIKDIKGNEILAKDHKGWNNKLFVSPEYMPHHIEITDVRIKQMHDLTDDDALKLGIIKYDGKIAPQRKWANAYTFRGATEYWKTPLESYKNLIKRIERSNVWSYNPWIFVYKFKLID